MKKIDETKEKRAMKWVSLRVGALDVMLIVAAYCGVMWLGFIIESRLEIKSDYKVIIALAICLLALGATLLVRRLCNMVYSLIRGMNIGIDESYVVNYRITYYQLSHLHEEFDHYSRQRITRLYLVMSLEELAALLREQRTSLRFSGHALLPVKFTIPGDDYSRLYICRSTIKRILAEAQREDWHFVELEFQFTIENYIGRTSYAWDRVLLSMWDVAKLRLAHQGELDIQVYNDEGKYIITREELDQYERTLTESYQIINPPFVTQQY